LLLPRLCLVIAIFAGTLDLLAADQDSRQSPAPTFRGAVRQIEVDIIVTDGDGRPVRDLTQEEFEIREDDRVQRVQTFSMVDLPVSSQVISQGEIASFPSDTATNTLAEGRTYVLLLDSESTIRAPQSPESVVLRTKQLARQFLNEAVQPGDQVAVVHAQGTTTDGLGFTTNLRLIDQSIERFGRGLSGTPPRSAMEQVSRTLTTYRAFSDIAERLGPVTGRRKIIVWIGGQIDVHPERYQEQSLRKVHPIFAAASTLLTALRDALQVAARNNVAVYPVDPVGLTTATGIDELIRTASLRSIAEDTGGLATVNTNNFTDAFAAIVREASTYYLLSYSPDRNHPEDGAFHAIDVRVRRPGVTVRARRGYYMLPSTLPASGSATQTTVRGVSEVAAAALRRPLPVAGIGIDVAALPFKSSGRNVSVVITAHVHGSSLRLDGNQQLGVAYQVLDVDGKVVTGGYKTFGLSLAPATRERVARTGLRFVERLSVRPGRYEIRLVAEQPGWSLGSVVTHIDALEPESPLSLSGMVLASTQAARELLLVGDPQLREALTVDPTALRRFGRDERLVVFAEAYGRSLDDVAVVGSITALTGSTIMRIDAQPVPRARNSEGRGFRAEFDLAGVTPGRYVATLEARSTRQPDRIARHQVQFTVE
jgi:VWFA-related protein